MPDSSFSKERGLLHRNQIYAFEKSRILHREARAPEVQPSQSVVLLDPMLMKACKEADVSASTGTSLDWRQQQPTEQEFE
jgi:hypothetical protein